MKKTTFIVAVAIVMLLAMAGAAFATQGDSGYLGAGGVSPHGGYQVTTKKCAVCHAVHHAGEFGDGLGSEALLRSTRGNACTYCHISPGVSTKIVYGGVEGNYNGLDFNNAHSMTGGATCTGCHQVHAAANAMTNNAALTVKILKDITAAPIAGEAANEGSPTVGMGYDEALSNWCSECHAYYNTAVNGATHVLKASDGTHAFTASTYCDSCHNSTTVGGAVVSSAFPHYTDGVRFLTQAADGAAAATGAADSQYDGVCLRCHRDGTGAGIGLTF